MEDRRYPEDLTFDLEVFEMLLSLFDFNFSFIVYSDLFSEKKEDHFLSFPFYKFINI
jgi:hypothetical protein